MKPTYKLGLILWAIAILDITMGFDLRFTIINLVWCIPIAYDWYKESKEKK
jgi:hypothetical protein